MKPTLYVSHAQGAAFFDDAHQMSADSERCVMSKFNVGVKRTVTGGRQTAPENICVSNRNRNAWENRENGKSTEVSPEVLSRYTTIYAQENPCLCEVSRELASQRVSINELSKGFGDWHGNNFEWQKCLKARIELRQDLDVEKQRVDVEIKKMLNVCFLVNEMFFTHP